MIVVPLKETQTIYQRFVDEELKAELKAERHGKKDEEVKSGLGIARKKIKNLTLRDAIDGVCVFSPSVRHCLIQSLFSFKLYFLFFLVG